MLLNSLLWTGILHTATAQQWMHKGCEQYSDLISNAFGDAIEIADIAMDVLDGDGRNNEHVKDIINNILGSDEGQEARVDQIKSFLSGIRTIELEPATAVSSNKDVVVHCKFHYQEMDRGRLYNTDAGKIIGSRSADQYRECFEPSHDPGNEDEDEEDDSTFAITVASHQLDARGWHAERERWEAAGRPLWPGPPNKNSFMNPVEDKPSTIDLCTSFLEKVEEGYLERLDESYLARVARPDFSLDINDGDTHSPKIDMVTNSMTGVLLHELTHTSLGGLSVDEPIDNCYGWENVVDAQNPNNADTILILATALWAWDLGYLVTEEGDIVELP